MKNIEKIFRVALCVASSIAWAILMYELIVFLISVMMQHHG